MRTILNLRTLAMVSLLLFGCCVAIGQGQVDAKAANLKKLETSLAAAKAKVDLNERKLAVADSLITAGTKLIADSKSETKAIDSEMKKLDKDFAAEQKPLTKLTTSKDKEEATKAKADLKALNTQYKADSKALTTRLTAATKKATTGNANITKGKAQKAALKDSMKLAKESLDAAQKKYDAATGADEKPAAKSKKKK
jgi:chromosome segregation ATPase